MKRLIAFVIAGFATAAIAFGAAAGSASHGDWSQSLASMGHDLPAFLHYHPTDGSPLRP